MCKTNLKIDIIIHHNKKFMKWAMSKFKFKKKHLSKFTLHKIRD